MTTQNISFPCKLKGIANWNKYSGCQAMSHLSMLAFPGVCEYAIDTLCWRRCWCTQVHHRRCPLSESDLFQRKHCNVLNAILSVSKSLNVHTLQFWPPALWLQFTSWDQIWACCRRERVSVAQIWSCRRFYLEVAPRSIHLDRLSQTWPTVLRHLFCNWNCLISRSNCHF